MIRFLSLCVPLGVAIAVAGAAMTLGWAWGWKAAWHATKEMFDDLDEMDARARSKGL